MARKPISNDRYRLVGTYERLRKSLLDRPDDGRLDKALSYWVLPSDRRLPMAFLDRTVRDLLSRPIEELMVTPGIGHMKIMGFFDLLKRISKATQPDAPFGLNNTEPARRQKPAVRGFDPLVVSESLWVSWNETVRRYGLGQEKLGRLAPSLQSLPTVIWHSRLDEYAGRSLAEIRHMKTHGEQRLNAILEVFYTVHEALATSTLQANIDVIIVPRFIPPMTRWLMETIDQPGFPAVEALHLHLVKPLIHQIKIDLGDRVAALAANRLSLDKNAPSVKQQADTIDVTRARVYQLLEDCAKVMNVRWPEGRWLFAPLTARFGTADPTTIGLMHGIINLFYPHEPSAGAMLDEHRYAVQA
jgi:hypothetical protein